MLKDYKIENTNPLVEQYDCKSGENLEKINSIIIKHFNCLSSEIAILSPVAAIKDYNKNNI